MSFSRQLLQCGAVATVLMSGVGCQNYPFAFQKNQRVDARDYESRISTTDKTDILFVIDNSPSMLEAKENIQQNMVKFITDLSGTTNDYQIGVITVDANRVPAVPETGTCDPCCDLDTDGDGHPDFSNCDGGRLAAADGKLRILKRPTSLDPDENAAQVQDVIRNFNAILTAIGSNGDSYERAFQTLQWALGQDDATSPQAVRDINYGFLRPDAALAIIFASDEDDCTDLNLSWYTDPGRDDSQCYTTDQLADPQQFVDFLVGVKNGDLDKVRAAAIVGAATGPNAGPLNYAAAGCYTDESGAPSNVCGCSAQRFVPDTSTPEVGDDLFCNLLAGPPYNQPNDRIPSLPNNQGGCQKVPGKRYVQLMNDLYNERVAKLSTLDGVYLDSLCRADYGPTLQNILGSVVLNNCFTLVEAPSGNILDNAVVIRNGDALPRVEKAEQAKTPDVGWYYEPDVNGNNGGRICLQGIIKKVNDTYEILVISGAKGFDDDTTDTSATP